MVRAGYRRLRVELEAAHEASTLPEMPSEVTKAALNDLLVRVRIAGTKLEHRPAAKTDFRCQGCAEIFQGFG